MAFGSHAAQRHEPYNATVESIRRIHDDLMVLRVRPDEPIPPFDAGQWIALGIGLWEPRMRGAPPESLEPSECANLVHRPLSIGSPVLAPTQDRLLDPSEEDAFEFYVVLPRGAPKPPPFTWRLFALDPGSRLWVDEKPRGQNTLATVQPDDNVLFTATGTGEAPHNRMLWDLLRRGHRGRIASIVSTHRQVDQGYREMHERVQKLFPNYRYAGIATREPGPDNVRLQALLQSGRMEELAGFALEPRRARVFVCGNPEMIGAPRLQDGRFIYPPALGMVELLERERGFHAGTRTGNINLHFERY